MRKRASMDGYKRINANAIRTITAAFIWLPSAAPALQLTYGLEGGTEYSSNIMRDPHGKSEWMPTVAAGASLVENTAALQMDVRSTLQLQDYVHNSYTDQTLFNLASDINWALIPDNFIWRFQDYFRQLPIDTFNATTPGNIQDTNVIWTGPDFIIDLTPIDKILTGIRVGQYYYEVSPLDNSRYAVQAGLMHLLSQNANISLNTQYMSTNYSNDDRNSDFDRTDEYINFTRKLPLTELNINLGGTQINRDQESTISGLAGSTSIMRRLNSTTRATFFYSSRLTENGSELLATLPGTLTTYIPAASLTSDIGRVREGRFLLEFNRGANLNTWSVFHSTENYDSENVTPEIEVVDLDRDITGTEATFGFTVTPLDTATLHGGYINTKYSSAARRDNTWMGGVTYTHRLAPNVFLDFDVSQIHNQSDDPGEKYNETRALLYFRYGIMPSI